MAYRLELKTADGLWVEPWSDLEMRTLWLSLVVLLDQPVLTLLEHIWPVAGGAVPSLRLAILEPLFPDHRVSFEDIVLERLGMGDAVLGVRSAATKPWEAAAFGREFGEGTQLLLLVGGLSK